MNNNENIKIDLNYQHSDLFKNIEIKKLDKNIAGIYFLYNVDNEIIYIGKAKKCIKNRLNYHLFLKNPERYNHFNNAWKMYVRKEYYSYTFIEVKPKIIDILEVFLINKYIPIYNIEFNKNGLIQKNLFRDNIYIQPQ